MTRYSLLCAALGALALPSFSQTPTGAQVIQEMIAHCRLNEHLNIVRVEFTAWENHEAFSGTGVLNDGTATYKAPVSNVTSTYNTLVGSATTKDPFKTNTTFSSGFALGWPTITPISLGSLVVSLPNGTKKNFLIPTNAVVTRIGNTGNYQLSTPPSSGKAVTMLLSKSTIPQ